MKFGKYVEDHAVAEWATQYLSYKKLKKQIKRIVALGIPDLPKEHEKVREFEEMLNGEIFKITSFYLQKEGEAIDFYKQLQKFTAKLQTQPTHKESKKDSHDQPLLREVELLEIATSSAPFPPPSPTHILSSDPSTSLTLVSSDSDELHGEGIRKRKGRGSDDEDETFPEKFAMRLQARFLKGFQYSEHLLGGLASTLKDKKWLRDSKMAEHDKAKIRLAEAAALEYYRGLVLLKNYAIINYTGFIKILKKADKLTKFKFRNEMLVHIAAQPFHVSDEVDRLMAGTEKVFGSSFLSGDIRQAKRILRVPERKSDPTRSFIAGTFLGLNLALGMLLIYTFITNSIYDPYDPHKIIFPQLRSVYTMFSALGLPILWTWVFGLDVLVWTKSHINYVFIFDMNPRWKLSHELCFEAVTSLTLMWLIAIGLYVWTSSGTFPLPHPPPVFFPLILALVFLFFIVCPFDIFYKQGRYWILNTLKRIAMAPLKPVKFKDFFIADQLTSLVLVLVQLQFLICYYIKDVWNDPVQPVCFTLQPKISPFLSALPAFWRFMQCIRRYRDCKESVHLMNAGKYSCTFLVVIFSTLDSTYGAQLWNSYKICWLVAATINSLYAYCWDIFMDWSILYYKKGKFTIRKKRAYPYNWLYLWAAISNLVLRFTWSLTKSNLLQLFDLVQWELLVVIAAAEIFRRGQWNLFRMENEHLNNCGKFRAVQELQLPI